MGLNMISVYVPDLQSNPEMFAFLEHYASMGYASVLLFLFVGMVLTAVIQSSAATFAIVLIMCTKGWISFDLACAVVLGSNIGTTITPLLASLSGNIAAKRTAMGHLLFNLFGLLWTLVVFYPFVRLNVGITEALGQGNPDEMFSFVNNLEATDPQTYNAYVGETLPASHPILAQVAKMQFSVSFGLSMFHTVFNLVNVMIMIWLTGVYVKIVEKIMPAKNKEDGEFQLRFISAGLLSASELNIAQAEKEMVVYAQRVRRMVTILETFAHTDSKTEDYSRLYSRLEKYEDISDRMQLEISNYLRRCSEGRLSNEAKGHVVAMLNIASEIESIADCCYRSAKILVRKSEQSIEFDNIIIENIDSMFSDVKEAIDNMIRLLANIEHVREADIVKSYNKEREINNLRNQLRTGNVKNINNHVYEFQAGNFYMDIINDLEKMGDYIINVTGTIRDSYLRHTV
jgi:phosphate:Na+ symporter